MSSTRYGGGGGGGIPLPAPGSAVAGNVLSYNGSSWVAGSGWATLYDVDFSAQPTQDMLADGNYVIGGLTWAAVGGATFSQRGVINGSGLRMTTTAVGSQLGPGAQRTAGYIHVPMTTLLPSFDLSYSKVRVLMKVVYPVPHINNVYAGIRVGSLSSVANAQLLLAAFNMTDFGTQIYLNQSYNSASVYSSNLASTVNDSMRFSFGDAFALLEMGQYAAGAWPTSWKPVMKWTTGDTVMGYPWRASQTDMDLVVTVSNGGSAIITSGTVVRLRVDVNSNQ